MNAVADHVRRVLRERWWIVVVVVVAFVGVAMLWDERIPDASTSSADVSVAPAGLRAPLVGVRSLKPPTPAELNGRVGLLVAEPAVQRRVARRLTREGLGPFRPRIAPSPVEGWFRVSVLAPTARQATGAANAWADVLADEITEQDRRQIDEVIRSFRSQRREVRRRTAADPARGRFILEIQIDRLRILRRVGKTAEVVRPARDETAKATDLSNRLPGSALFGLSLGLVLAFLADAYSRRPRDPGRLAESAGLEVVATLPAKPHEGDYDRVRASLVDVLLDDADTETVVVTSPGRDDGCAGLAAGLVRAFARAGDSYTVIDAPGVIASADALAAAERAALVLVSAHAGRTTIDELQAASGALGRIPGVRVRLVVGGVRRGSGTRTHTNPGERERVPA